MEIFTPGRRSAETGYSVSSIPARARHLRTSFQCEGSSCPLCLPVCPAGVVERHTKKATALNGEISSRSEPKLQKRPPFRIDPNRHSGRDCPAMPRAFSPLPRRIPATEENRQDNRGRTFLPRRSGAACTPVPAMASFSRRTGVRYDPVTRRQLIANPFRWRRSSSRWRPAIPTAATKDVANLALELLLHFEKFFAFLRHEGVEPTNNVAEGALRCVVQWRKISFGSRSPKGEVAVACLLTATRTCRMQNRAPLNYLVTALRSHRNVLPTQSLLKIASTAIY